MAEVETLPISLTVDRSGEPRLYSSAKDVHEWLGAETRRWLWLQELRSQFPSTKQILIAQLHPLSNELSQLDSAANDSERYQRQAINTAVSISTLVSNGKLLTSESAAGKFVLAMVDQKRFLVSAYALGYLIDSSTSTSEVPDQLFQGKFLAAGFQYGIRETAESQKLALEALVAEFRSAIESQRTNVATADARHKELLNESETEIANAKKAFTDAEGERHSDVLKALASYEERFENLRATFVENMKLKAPVKYWTSSAMWHRVTAGVYGLFALVWGIVVGYNTYTIAMGLVEASVKGQIEKPPYWEIGLFLLLVTLAVWLLRVLVRMTLSSLHLATDAKSRATMTEAYLALIEGGHALPEKDRILVLTTLFRPVSTGLIKDDGMPPSISEWLSKIVGGRGN